MDHETPDIETDQIDDEFFLITVDEFYGLLMEQQKQCSLRIRRNNL